MRATQSIAIASTIFCAIVGVACAVLLHGSRGSGGGGLWLVFPILVAVGSHVMLGPVAIVCALVSGQHRRNLWIYAYYVIAVPLLAGSMMGSGPSQTIDRMLIAPISSRLDAVLRPAETAICKALAESIVASQSDGGKTEPIHVALKRDIDVDFRCHARSPILWRRALHRATLIQLAAADARLELVEALLERGARPDERSTRGESALQLALTRGEVFSPRWTLARPRSDAAARRAIAMRLIAAGAEVDQTGRHGYSMLHWAAATGDVELTEFLLANGANPDAVNRGNGQPVASHVILTAAAVAEHDWGDEMPSAALAALRERHAQVLALLMAAGSDLEPVLDTLLRTRVEWALDPLIDANIGLASYVADEAPSLLRRTLVDEDEALFRRLVVLGADVNRLDASGKPPLAYFLHPRNAWQLNLLLDVGANANVRDNRGVSVLHTAATRGHFDATRRLLEAGANISESLLRDVNNEMRTMLEAYR